MKPLSWLAAVAITAGVIIFLMSVKEHSPVPSHVDAASRPAEPPVEVTARMIVAEPAPDSLHDDGASDTVEEPAPAASPTQRSFNSLLAALTRARAALEDVPAYYAVLEKQVFLEGRLHEQEVMDIKVRHEPFSVYLKWQSDQQEVLYVDGEHDGRLLVHPTRGLISLRKVWKLPPDSPQAMKRNRHPVTALGLQQLYEMIDGFHQSRGYSTDGLECRDYEEIVNGVRCFRVETTFPTPREGGEFSRSIVTFCPKTDLVIGIENYGWTKDGRPGQLLERYHYRDVSVKPVIPDLDFKMDNPAYNFL